MSCQGKRLSVGDADQKSLFVEDFDRIGHQGNAYRSCPGMATPDLVEYYRNGETHDPPA